MSMTMDSTGTQCCVLMVMTITFYYYDYYTDYVMTITCYDELLCYDELFFIFVAKMSKNTPLIPL